jgi:ABC-type polysaccharide/polyol phosphate transport system ATPase subunit
MTPAIRIAGLSKSYPVYARPADALLEALLRRPRHRLHHALHDVSLDIPRGQRVGIIGPNGAGKSTLLRILAGTLDHTAGSFELSGRVRAILELGTGFHEECSGRENVLMGGLCLGYSRRELAESLEWVIDFSELRPVIERPLRTYSSGMKARLMFATAFCRPAEVLIVDEALATGDGAFVRKCTQHIVSLCQGGATALVVSHNLYLLERLCDRVVYLRDGRVLADGDPLAVCKRYEEDLGRAFAGDSGAPLAPGAVEPPVAIAVVPATPVPASPAPAPPAVHDEPRLPPGRAPSNGKGLVLQPDGSWQEHDFSGAPPVRALGLCRLLDARLLDARGQPTGVLRTGEPARFRFTFESRVRKADAHVGIMIWSERGPHVATTTNVCALDAAGRPDTNRIDLVEGVLQVEVAFPALRLGAGRYWLKFGVNAGWEHFSDDDQLLAEHRVCPFAVLREDHVQDVFWEPESRWSALVRLAAAPPPGAPAGNAPAAPAAPVQEPA